jgi:hypothetical protein
LRSRFKATPIRDPGQASIDPSRTRQQSDFGINSHSIRADPVITTDHCRVKFLMKDGMPDSMQMGCQTSDRVTGFDVLTGDAGWA